MKNRVIAMLAALSMLAVVSAPVSAEMKGKTELSAQAGWTFFEGDMPIDDALIYGGRLGHFLTDHLSAEFAFFYGNTESGSIDIAISYPSLGLLYHFTTSGLIPFIQAGAGVLRYNPDVSSDNFTDFVIHGGVGLKLMLSPNFLLRVDGVYVRDTDISEFRDTYMAMGGISVLLGGSKKEEKPAPAPAPVPAPMAAPAPVDTDNDGVFDDKDICPNTPSGTYVDSKGCPIDLDKDGVIDSKDACPNTPMGVKVDANGCPIPEPKPMPAPVVPEDTWVLKGTNFKINSATITTDSFPVLDEAADILAAHPAVRVEIQGHTDSVGDDNYNMQLSERRAQAVKDYLVGKGISADRMEVKGYGETAPIGDNATSLGRRTNRRIEFKVLSK